MRSPLLAASTIILTAILTAGRSRATLVLGDLALESLPGRLARDAQHLADLLQRGAMLTRILQRDPPLRAEHIHQMGIGLKRIERARRGQCVERPLGSC